MAGLTSAEEAVLPNMHELGQTLMTEEEVRAELMAMSALELQKLIIEILNNVETGHTATDAFMDQVELAVTVLAEKATPPKKKTKSSTVPPLAFGKVIDQADIHETEMYRRLTIGSTKDYMSQLRKATSLGGGALIAVTIADKDSTAHASPKQVEALF